MKVRTTLIASFFVLACILNIIYYRQFFIEQLMRFQMSSENIVVTFSTTPHRINEIGPTIKSLLAQNANISKIYLTIPYTFKRENIQYKIPQWLLDQKQITILRTEDYGPATKLLGVLAQVSLPPNTIIITVDDDVIYPKNLVLQLAYKAMQNPHSAFGILGSDLEYDDNGIITNKNELGMIRNHTPDAVVSTLQGYAGIAYRRSFFDASIFNITKAPRECINADDLYVAFYLAQHHIPRQVPRNKYISSCNINWGTDIGVAAHSLHQLTPKPADKHRVCLSYLKHLSPETVF